MKISIDVSSKENRYIIFNIDDDLFSCDENISKILGIELHNYVERFKNVCKFYNHSMSGINITDSISNQEIIKRFEQEFASELVILKMEGCELI